MPVPRALQTRSPRDGQASTFTAQECCFYCSWPLISHGPKPASPRKTPPHAFTRVSPDRQRNHSASQGELTRPQPGRNPGLRVSEGRIGWGTTSAGPWGDNHHLPLPRWHKMCVLKFPSEKLFKMNDMVTEVKHILQVWDVSVLGGGISKKLISESAFEWSCAGTTCKPRMPTPCLRCDCPGKGSRTQTAPSNCRVRV